MFENSIKMKLSIIFGIIHMIFGIILSYFNFRYFKKTYLIFFQFIPQMLFISCLFVWLVLMIYMKWFIYGAKEAEVRKNSFCAPQILIIFIDMVLLSKPKESDNDCKPLMFSFQYTFQLFLLLVALLCVPVLLLGPPIYENKQNKKMLKAMEKKTSNFRKYQRSDTDVTKQEETSSPDLAKYSKSFGDIMIHQGIFTMEYVLSTISHTASYLRLWALSLAHAELSEMLWKMVLRGLALSDHSIVGAFKLFVIFAIWATFTMSILVVMEGLSAFLHTLRLHWVEFMTKFFEGGGWFFTPFSFNKILSSDGDDKAAEALCKPKQNG